MSLTPSQLAALRQDYSLKGLRRADLDPDPVQQFRRWLAEAHEHSLLEPNAMTIATADPQGRPWTRTVLLKAVDERGFIFFTNYDGAKGRHLAANPQAALTFWWAPLERQVNVVGTVTKTSQEESEQYFHSRPIGSQIGAWASNQSTIIADRAELEQRFEETQRRFSEGIIPLPPHWGGYIVRPEIVEFWQGRRSRLHDRLRYTLRSDATWAIERLSP